jgi:hypothetical protein
MGFRRRVATIWPKVRGLFIFKFLLANASQKFCDNTLNLGARITQLM